MAFFTPPSYRATNTLGVPQRLAHLIHHCAAGTVGITAHITAPGLDAERTYPMHQNNNGDWQTDDLGLIVLPGETITFWFDERRPI